MISVLDRPDALGPETVRWETVGKSRVVEVEVEAEAAAADAAADSELEDCDR